LRPAVELRLASEINQLLLENMKAYMKTRYATLAGSSSLHVGQRIAHGGALGATQPGSPKTHLKLKLKLPCSPPRTKPDLAEKKILCD
jgi:hypothetical protein